MTSHKIKFLLRVDIIVTKDGSEYHAFCPAFKGLHVFGVTVKEAIENAKHGIVANVISLFKHKEPIPCCEIIEESSLSDIIPYVNLRRHIHTENVTIPLTCPQMA